MRYLDVCAGISASTVAWKPRGWEAAAYSEIEAAPRAILAHHYPSVPCHGDFTTILGDEYGAIDLLVGGTPCQDFSIAGLRAGLDGERGNLSLEYLRLADRTRPRWLVWENVPGVLSIDGGRAFGAILGGMGELGYGFAYSILDAQHFGVPQRRRRVFVVGYLGDWRRAAAVLFERHSLSGHPAPRRETRPIVAALTSAGVGTCGADDNQGQAGHLIAQAFGGGNTSGAIDVATAQTAHGVRLDFDTETFIAHSLRGEGFDASEDGTGRGTPLVPVAASAVRRLTPRECERLQGFPDDYTLVPHRGRMMADGPRYKALGNSMAVPVMRWIGERIEMVDQLQIRSAAA
jgi:DNA (cytosine-5)-methyltransferase 1